MRNNDLTTVTVAGLAQATFARPAKLIWAGSAACMHTMSDRINGIDNKLM